MPVDGDPVTKGWKTHYYGGASIFSLSATDEATVMRQNKPYERPTRYLCSVPTLGAHESGGRSSVSPFPPLDLPLDLRPALRELR